MHRNYQRWEFQKYTDSLLAQEKSSVTLQRGEDLQVALAFPNNYELGMANLGFQTVYRLFNEQPGVRAERVFVYPDPFGDIAQTLESRWSPKDVDLLAFSLTTEVDYAHVFQLLKNAAIPILKREREETDPIVLAGGIVCFMNPVPFEPFFDCFALGEAEGIILDLVAALRLCKDKGISRSQTLQILAEQDYLYVPTIHRPAQTKRSVYRLPWAEHVPAYSVIVTPVAHFGEMFLVEAGRGCGKRCKFCAASFLYQSYRPNELAQLQQVIQTKNVFECKNVGLLGSAIGDLKQLPQLCQWLNEENYRFSFSSLRLDRLTPELLATAKANGIKSITVAPEAGAEELRRLIRKSLTTESILQAACNLGQADINLVKMYFILAFPFELEEDTTAIAELVSLFGEQMKAAGTKKPSIRVSVNAFVPKPFTPLQWAPQVSEDLIQKKRRLLQHKLSSLPGVQLSARSSRFEVLQALLSLGDATLGESLYHAYEKGVNPFRQFKKDGIQVDEWLCREKERDQVLPWDFIIYPISREQLWQDFLDYRVGMKERIK